MVEQLSLFGSPEPEEAPKSAAPAAAPAQGVRVGRVAHKGSAVKGIIVKGIQTLELLGILFHHRDIMADAFQIADQRRTYLIAADHQYVHEGSPRCSQSFQRRAQKADRLLIFIV